MTGKGLVSIAEFARQLKVSRSAVQYAIKKGRIDLQTVDGKKVINLATGKKQWASTLDKKASDKAKSKGKKIIVEEYEPPAKFDKYGDMTTAEAERRDKVNRAKLSELKYKEQAKLLVEADKVKRRAFLLARKTRDAIMQVPARHSHELAVETDPHKLEVKLSKILEKAIQKLITEERKNAKKD